MNLEEMIEWVRREVNLHGKSVEDSLDSYRQLLPSLETEQQICQAREVLSGEQRAITDLRPGPYLQAEEKEAWYTRPTVGGRWTELKKHLLAKGWGSALPSIDEASTKVVSLLARPCQRPFSNKGLVVGFVQSGKTANMTAVIAKAADAGYNLFIILSGLTNSLRNQTQVRFQDDLTSRNTDKWLWHTLEGNHGDFRLPPGLALPAPGEIRALMVIKKNHRVLERLIKAIGKMSPGWRNGIKALVIDDECDQASVNSSRYTTQMTAINRLMRQLVGCFDRCSYTGYTATPFANVLIDPYAQNQDPDDPERSLDDLYPRDFIFSLPVPAGYFGAQSLFGRSVLETDADSDEIDGLDMIRTVPDTEINGLRPRSRATREDFSPDIEGALEEALLYHVMATAARLARSHDDQPCGMLIHTTSYVAPHNAMRKAVRSWLDTLPGRMGNDADLRTCMKSLWEEEGTRVDSATWDLNWPTFEEIERHFDELLIGDGRIRVLAENGQSERRLDFEESDDPDREKTLRYIVVGGNVLARGLTLEGLTTSFFVRSSSQYDTLMQMGRWFGYRSGYQDLPRAWMTDSLRAGFRDLATVEAEIRHEIQLNQDLGLSPLEAAVHIRQVPGMAITAKNRMRGAEYTDISLSGKHRQTFRFLASDENWIQSNRKAAERLLAGAMEAGEESTPRTGSGKVLRGVPVSHLKKFFENYKVHETHPEIEGDAILNYISGEEESGSSSLSHWTVILTGPNKGSGQTSLSGIDLQLTSRARLKKTKDQPVADIRALMSAADLLLDTDLKPGNGWDENRNARQESGHTEPQLFLYVLDPDSQPRSKARVALGAVKEIVAMGVSFPKSERPRGEAYVSVRLRQLDAGTEDHDGDAGDLGIDDGDENE